MSRRIQSETRPCSKLTSGRNNRQLAQLKEQLFLLRWQLKEILRRAKRTTQMTDHRQHRHLAVTPGLCGSLCQQPSQARWRNYTSTTLTSITPLFSTSSRNKRMPDTSNSAEMIKRDKPPESLDWRGLGYFCQLPHKFGGRTASQLANFQLPLRRAANTARFLIISEIRRLANDKLVSTFKTVKRTQNFTKCTELLSSFSAVAFRHIETSDYFKAEPKGSRGPIALPS